MGSTIVGLQHTTNVAQFHDVATDRRWLDTLGASFYRPIEWTLEPPGADAAFEAWFRQQVIAWWLRKLNAEIYTAGFQQWDDSVKDWRIRWVFATVEHGPFAESRPTDMQPAFIRGGRIYSVRIRPDGQTEVIVGDAPKPPRSN
jgi:hypothetical protein